MPFTFQPLPELPDVILIEPKAFGDDRGWFMETFKQSEFESAGIREAFRQDNYSRSSSAGSRAAASNAVLLRPCSGMWSIDLGGTEC